MMSYHFLKRGKKPWSLPESSVTDEHVFHNRRRLIKMAGVIGGVAVATGTSMRSYAREEVKQEGLMGTDALYPAKANSAYELEDQTPASLSSIYNNFYEFGAHKNIWQEAQKLPLEPWTVSVSGLVEESKVWDVDTLIKAMPLEERVYRFRCVEAWAMVVPWTGFPMSEFLKVVRPLSSAKYVKMQTFYDPQVARNQKQSWYPWPYTEAISMPEAMNELTFCVTGVYGKPLLKQYGAPLRMIFPWKYGFKSVKSLTKISFVAKKPKTFWNTIAPREYGFWANVNPNVPHPRWSQRTERLLGETTRQPTYMYNGYGAQVASLYETDAMKKLGNQRYR